jgi:hypothetical protein
MKKIKAKRFCKVHLKNGIMIEVPSGHRYCWKCYKESYRVCHLRAVHKYNAKMRLKNEK